MRTESDSTMLSQDRRRIAVPPAFALAILAAIVIRAIFLMQFRHCPTFSLPVGADVMEYDRWAREMVVQGIGWDRIRIHAPLYPIFLSIVYRLTGCSVGVARVVQLLLDVASLLLVSSAVARLWGRRAGTFCAWFWALYFPIIYYSAELLSESMVVFWLSMGLFLAVKLFHECEAAGFRHLLLRSGLVGACCGMASIAHPLALLYGLILGVALPYVVTVAGRTRKAALGMALLVGMMMPVLPVALRNHAVSGEWVLIQGNEGLNLYIGNNPDATGTCYLRPGPAYDQVATWPSREGVASEAGAKQFFRKKVMSFIRQQPLAATRLLVTKLFLTWNHEDIPSGADTPTMQRLTPIMGAPLLSFGVIGPLALLGIWFCRRDPRAAPFLFLVGAFTAGLTIFVTSGRYRVGMLPGIFASAAVALDRLLLWYGMRERRSDLEKSLVLLGLASAVVLLPSAPSLPDEKTETALLIGEAAWRSGDMHMAERVLRNASRYSPNNAAIYHLLGNVYLQQHKLLRAREAFIRSIELDPTRAMAKVDLGILLSDTGELEEASYWFKAALATDDTCAQAYYNLGVLQERAGQTALAEENYRQAMRLQAAFVSPRINCAVLLHRNGKRSEAKPLYETVLKLEPRKHNALIGLAVLQLETGSTAAARNLLKRTIRYYPDDQVAKQILDSLSRQHEYPVMEPTDRPGDAKNDKKE